MGVIQYPTPIPGTVGDFPNIKFMVTTDNLATITTAGYLNSTNSESATPLSNNDVVFALYNYVIATTAGTFGIFTVTVSALTGITLVEWTGTSGVVLPTIANHIATYTNTTGQLSEDAATAINGGNIQAGLSGTAGTVASFPSTALKGSLKLAAVANTGNTVTTISNDAMGQASVVNIPDPANAIGQLLIGATATPFVSGNFPQNSGTAGLMVDSGVAVSSIATTSTAVLLSPSADQTITAHSLTTAQGNLVAGSSGHQGIVAAFPAGAAAGRLVLSAIGNTGNTDVTISNAIMGQASVISIPDPGTATAKFVLDTGTTAMAAGSQINLAKANGAEAANAVTASGNAGVITTSSLTTAGGASYAITWTNTHISTSSVILLTIMGGTNTTQNITLTATAGSGTSTLTIFNNTAATALNGTILIGYAIL